ncbi:AAA domain-containing protein [Massilia sp. G4R7]|uniref:AAA domain-containing protein n=1 Tax=Massilia phyllostachyos TaxID=2898585 RepID=A0ABS8PZK7_9BURK|nr:AAA domain-containing protein [Massilia phyllostachyos]
MKFEEMLAQSKLQCWGDIGGRDAMPAPGPVELHIGERAGEIVLAQDGRLAYFVAQEPGMAGRLEQVLCSGAAVLARVVMVKERALQLALRIYHGGLHQFAEIDIAFDDAQVTACERYGIRGGQSDEILRKLESRMLYRANTDSDARFVIEALPVLPAGSDPDQLLERGFMMLGAGIQLEVALRERDDAEPMFVARRLTLVRNTRADSLRLAGARVRFVDHTRLGQLRPLARAAMAQLTQGPGSYFRAWDAYGSMEGDMLLQRARLVGSLRPTTIEAVPGGTRFFIDGGIAREVVDELDQVDVVTEPPSYLRDPTLDWDAYCEEQAERKPAEETRIHTAKVREITAHYVTLELAFHAGLADAYLVLSMTGDLEQIKSRRTARERILAGRSANPMLGLLIERDGKLPRATRPPRIEPLSPDPAQRAKVFRKPPTERQLAAIELALNTPDIMVIQGPPGTGKTTVITAIIERLNEVRDKRAPAKGQVLLTAHQHDAVDNVLSRLKIDGRPAIKFGTRRGADADAAPASVDGWSDAVMAALRAAHPALRQSELQLELARQASSYLAAPSLARAVALLRHIGGLPPQVLDAELAQQNRDLQATIGDELQGSALDDGGRARLLRTLHGLRTSAAGFADDGPAGVAALLHACGDELDEADAALLERALSWPVGATPSFLDALEALKTRLLARHCRPPPFRFDKPRDDVLTHLAAVSRALEQHERASGDPVAAVLADFVHELEGNPGAAPEALAEYSFVFAATCQGTDRNAIRRAKRSMASRFGADPEYDTVIIDEAARVSPRDLLIPMAQGLRRIILVGDHRQLPHIVEEGIIRQLETDAGDTTMLQQSAFQYLRERALELEKRDGITRTVTLDCQYRMHSLLGKFVSKQFYDDHGEGFGSPDDDAPYAHALDGAAGYPLAWLEVEHGAGPAKQRPPSSWYRKAEAERIAERLHAWIESDEGKARSFGIITFYRAQVDTLLEALGAYGYAQRTPSGEWAIVPDYRRKIGDAEHLRVGTVDAFQGMEFDVVFLSTVRSPGPPRRDRSVPTAAGLFGRLQTVSLQCVALSRQKRLLVVAGDSGLLEHPLAPQAVPALHALRALCRTEGVAL